jgi:hypothetical protein
LAVTVTTALAPDELETVMFPLTCSEAVGLKVTLITAFCPAPRVSGAVIPLTTMSLALTLTCEIVKLVLPLLVIVTFWELELPAFTLTKLTLLGLAVSATDPDVPVPVRFNVLGELGALLKMLTVPVMVPAVVGANRTLNVALLPALMVTGTTRPLTL